MKDVVIIGGGLAGLAAAVKLAPNGYRITILEARPRLGGRASSFNDPVTGELTDICQHVTMGCCKSFARFAKTIGVSRFLEEQPTLYFMTPDRRVSRFRRDPWPAPLHLGRALASAHYLSLSEKTRIAWGMLCLVRESENDPPLLPWLQEHRQTPRCIERFWNVVLTSALNESVGNLGVKYARKVFIDAFLADPDGFTVSLPMVPLGRFYGEELRKWLADHAVKVVENCAARRIQITRLRDSASRFSVACRDDQVLNAGHVILAVPFHRVSDLLPERGPFFESISKLEPSPITSVHFWFDRDAIAYPHIVLVDCLGQWVFRKKCGYVQVVTSASRQLKSLGRDEIERRILEELRTLFPRLQDAALIRSKVVTEHSATFRAVPGVDAFRPGQATPIPGLFLAGDWTATGWPATMEGAVRSGELAAAALMASEGTHPEFR